MTVSTIRCVGYLTFLISRLLPNSLKTHQILTAHSIPCTVILDSAVAYVLPRVSLVLVGTEAVVESGGLVSSVGTAQMAALAKMNGKPVYAVAESYKFLRYYPLGMDDLPRMKVWKPADDAKEEKQGAWVDEPLPLEFDELDVDEEEGDNPHSDERAARPRRRGTAPATPRRVSVADDTMDPMEALFTARARGSSVAPGRMERWEMTREMERKQPLYDITTAELVDFVITDLGAL
jgi:translation initiation factor eIF-2B subunit alpha